MLVSKNYHHFVDHWFLRHLRYAGNIRRDLNTNRQEAAAPSSSTLAARAAWPTPPERTTTAAASPPLAAVALAMLGEGANIPDLSRSSPALGVGPSSPNFIRGEVVDGGEVWLLATMAAMMENTI